MIARVTLELALRKEFDYAIPPELAEHVDVGSRVQVPFGARKVLGCVTGLAEESDYPNLKSILKVIGAQTLVTPKILKLARWIGEYYCCAPETALKSRPARGGSPGAGVGWRQRLYVRVLPAAGEPPKLAKRQKEVLRLVEERRELPLTELLELAGTTAATVRHLPRGQGTSHRHQRNLRARPLCARAHFALATASAELSPSHGTRGNHIRDGPGHDAARERQHPFIFRLPAAWSDRQRQDGGLSSGHRPCVGTGKGRYRSRSGNRAHAPDRRTIQSTLHFRNFAHDGGGVAQPLVDAGERHDEWHKIRQGRAPES